MAIEQQNKDGGSQGLADLLNSEELDCKICYCLYNLGGRRPKMLECCHRLCTKCLVKILDLGESPPNAVVCPFCRYITRLPEEAVGNLPDDNNLVQALAVQSTNQRNLQLHPEATTELLLSPRHLSSLVSTNPPMTSPSSSTSSFSSSVSSSTTYSSIQSSTNFVVITIMEPPPAAEDFLSQPYRSHSLDSMVSMTQWCTVWNWAALLCQTSARALVWVLGLLYFSSLPTGVYLLIMQRTTLGVLLVSLVPASLIMITAYGFCQCVCRELRECMST